MWAVTRRSTKARDEYDHAMAYVREGGIGDHVTARQALIDMVRDELTSFITRPGEVNEYCVTRLVKILNQILAGNDAGENEGLRFELSEYGRKAA
jgi:hypothetical protein